MNKIASKLSPGIDPPFLVLDLRLNIVNSVGRLHLEGDSLARKGLDEYLHLELLLSTHSVDKRQVIQCGVLAPNFIFRLYSF